MLVSYKRGTFLETYRTLSLHERINTKYADYRAVSWNFRNAFEDDDFLIELPRIDRKL